MTRAIRTAALSLAIVATVAAAVPAAESERDAGAVSDLAVTVKYVGKGTVDAKHRVWVWLFDTPDLGPGAMPFDEASIEKNGDTITFKGITAKAVYVAVAYDEAGGFGGMAPPPSGSPIGVYSGAQPGPPAPIIPGETTAVTVTFNEMMRMP